MKKFFPSLVIMASLIPGSVHLANAGSPRGNDSNSKMSKQPLKQPKVSTPNAQHPLFDPALSASPASIPANGFDTIVSSVAVKELLQRNALTYRGVSLSNLIPDASKSALTTSMFQGALFSALTQTLSENPALFGGNRSRGFNPVIWKALVGAYQTRIIPITTDGILLMPPRGLQLRYNTQAAEVRASGAIVNVDLYLTTASGKLVGHDLKPIEFAAYETEDEGPATIGSQERDFAHYGGRLESMLQSHSMILTSRTEEPADLAQDLAAQTLSQCFAYAAAEQWQQAADCFKQAGETSLQKGVEVVQNMLISGARGAAVGAPVGAIVPGWGAAAGATYGALSNMLMVLYNSFLKKEVITGSQIQNLMDLFDLYGYKPTPFGQVMPRPGTRWIISKTGVARLATVTDGKLVHVDILGRPVMVRQNIQLSPGAVEGLHILGGDPKATGEQQVQTTTSNP